MLSETHEGPIASFRAQSLLNQLFAFKRVTQRNIMASPTVVIARNSQAIWLAYDYFEYDLRTILPQILAEPLPLRKVRISCFCSQICSGLSGLQSGKICLLSLNPEQILIDRRNRLAVWGAWDSFEVGHPIRLDHDLDSLASLVPEVLMNC
jgi:serine/threonine protein kinase